MRAWSSEWWTNSSSASKYKRCDSSPGLTDSQSAIWVGWRWAPTQQEWVSSCGKLCMELFCVCLRIYVLCIMPPCLSEWNVLYQYVWWGPNWWDNIHFEMKIAHFKFHWDFRWIWLKGLALAQLLSPKQRSLTDPKSSVDVSCAWVELVTMELWNKHVCEIYPSLICTASNKGEIFLISSEVNINELNASIKRQRLESQNNKQGHSFFPYKFSKRTPTEPRIFQDSFPSFPVYMNPYILDFSEMPACFIFLIQYFRRI